VLYEGRKIPNRPGKVIQVPIKKMDKFIEENKFDSIDFLRMDVEGFEYNIFKGMENTIEKFKPIIQIEVHKGHMGIEKTKKFFEFLKKHNYQAKSFHHRALDLPMIGTNKDIQSFTIDKLMEMLEENTLPNYFNLMLQTND